MANSSVMSVLRPRPLTKDFLVGGGIEIARSDKAISDATHLPPTSFGIMPDAALRDISRARPSWGVDKVSELLGRRFRERQPAVEEKIRGLFGEFGPMYTRAKSRESIAAKLTLYFSALKSRINIPLHDNRQGVDLIMEDGVGARVVLSDLSPIGIDLLVEEILDAIMHGKLKVLRVRNYHGEGVDPYLSDRNIEGILVASDLSNIQIEVINGDGAIRKTGFTAFCMICEIDGILVDLQFMGPAVHEINAADHVSYKYLTQGITDAHYEHVIGGFTAVLKLLPLDLKVIYQRYLRDSFLWARKTEMGIEAPKPEVPPELKELHAFFDVDRLRHVLEFAKK